MPVPSVMPSSSQRLDNVDILRGIALLGIVLVNLFAFSAPYFLPGVRQLSLWQSPLSKGLEFVVWIAAEGAFYSIFSILFGWGMAQQWQRRGMAFFPYARRRLLVLACIGLVHLFLLWFGDILTTYAFTGALLLLVIGHSTRTLCILMAALMLLSLLLLPMPSYQLSLEQSQTNLATYLATYQGDWLGIQQARIRLGMQSLAGLPTLLPHILWLFILGVLAQRWQVMQRPEALRQPLRRVLAITLPLALLCKACYAYGLLYQPGTVGWRWAWSTFTGGPLLGISYAIMLILLLRRASWQRRLRPLASVGRMALSSYLAQSLVATFIFYGYGLGLYGRLEPMWSIPLMLLLYVGQVVFSRWWLAHHRHGPLEWLWRRLSAV